MKFNGYELQLILEAQKMKPRPDYSMLWSILLALAALGWLAWR